MKEIYNTVRKKCKICGKIHEYNVVIDHTGKAGDILEFLKLHEGYCHGCKRILESKENTEFICYYDCNKSYCADVFVPLLMFPDMEIEDISTVVLSSQ